MKSAVSTWKQVHEDESGSKVICGENSPTVGSLKAKLDKFKQIIHWIVTEHLHLVATVKYVL